MAETPTLAEVVRRAIDARISDLHVALPCQVQSYNNSQQTADVKPLIKRVIRTRDGSPVEESLPVIPNVPVLFPGANGFFVSFPIAVGDTGMLIFNERNIDRWREVGGDVNPGDQSMHPLSGAAFYPGLRTSANALGDTSASALAMGKDGGFVLNIRSNDTIELPEGSSKFLARADRVEAQIQLIVDAITNATVAGAPDAGAAFQASMVALMAASGVPNSTASDKVKGT